MRLEDQLDAYYMSNDKNMPRMKACYMGLCNDIERLLRTRLNVRMSDQLDAEKVTKIKQSYPSLMSFL